jgi:uncharacterized C2H2 Zn-finger protein
MKIPRTSLSSLPPPSPERKSGNHQVKLKLSIHNVSLISVDPMSSKPSTCTNCKAVFESRSSRDIHSRICNPSSTVSFPDGVVTIPQTEDGKYMCYCSHPKCPQPFERIDTLTRHVKRARSHWKGPPSSLVRNLTLNNLFLKIFTHHKKSLSQLHKIQFW